MALQWSPSTEHAKEVVRKRRGEEHAKRTYMYDESTYRESRRRHWRLTHHPGEKLLPNAPWCKRSGTN